MAPFGPGHTALNGNSMLDHPEGATMHRTRLIASLLTVVVLAASCGGDKPTTTTRDSAEQPDAAPEPEPQPVRLGDRFSWCAELQADWDRHPKPSAVW